MQKTKDQKGSVYHGIAGIGVVVSPPGPARGVGRPCPGSAD